MLVALISAVTSAVNLIVDKIILSRERVSLGVYLPIIFVFLFLLTFILVPTLGRVDLDLALLPNTLFLTVLMIVIAIAWNVLFYQSVQKEKIHQHELLMMTVPLVTIVLAAVFFPEEFDIRIFGLALLASLALIIAKSERHHFQFDQTSYNLSLGVVLMSIETIIIRELLYSYTPVALYALRTFFIAIFFLFYYRPRYRQVSQKHKLMILFSAFIGVIQVLTRFYAFDQLGIIYTALISILAPVIVFFVSWEILHERIRPRVVLASLIIMVCVTIATVLKFA